MGGGRHHFGRSPVGELVGRGADGAGGVDHVVNEDTQPP